MLEFDLKIDSIVIRGDEPVGPKPDIKANGEDKELKISSSDNINLTVSLDPGDSAGKQCDWWIGALTPFGTYWYNSSFKWVKSDTPIRVGKFALFDLPSRTILNTSLSPGLYTMFFILDDKPNGSLNMTWYDYVIVSITSEDRRILRPRSSR